MKRIIHDGAPALTLLIPAYNEERRLGGTLQAIHDHFQARPPGLAALEVLVVDDGSRDGTWALVRGWMPRMPGLRLVRHGRNRGKGSSVREGFRLARAPLVLMADADASTPLAMFDRLEAALTDGDLDFVIGSRPLPESEIQVRQSWLRQHLGMGFNGLVRLLLGLSVRDSQCGFKLFRRERCRGLFERGRVDGFAFDVELLAIARTHGLRYREVPVQWRNDPDSRVRLVAHALQMFRDLCRIRWRLARGRYGSGSGA